MTLYEKITFLRTKMGLSQSEFERLAGLSKGTVTNWKTKKPNMGSLEKAASALGCEISYLLEDDQTEPAYYINDDAKELAQFIFENPEYRVLFDASKNVKKEDIQFVREMIDRINSTN